MDAVGPTVAAQTVGQGPCSCRACWPGCCSPSVPPLPGCWWPAWRSPRSGDVGLEFDILFLVGMAGFLAMQVCYVLGFLGLGAWPSVRRRWAVAVGYLAFWVARQRGARPRLGDLRRPDPRLQPRACASMATFAAGVDRRVGLGGLLFLISDMLIGVDLAGPRIPGPRHGRDAHLPRRPVPHRHRVGSPGRPGRARPGVVGRHVVGHRSEVAPTIRGIAARVGPMALASSPPQRDGGGMAEKRRHRRWPWILLVIGALLVGLVLHRWWLVLLEHHLLGCPEGQPLQP